MALGKGAGKGLDALFGNTDIILKESGAASPIHLPISQVEPGLNQPRKNFDEEALQDLADSVAQYGVLQPLIVRKLDSGYHQIIAGERRWRAAKKAGLTEVPVVIIEADDRKVMEIGLIENLQREDLNPIEEAAGYRTLMQEYGLTQEETAEKVSKSRPAVANAMRLLALPQEIQWLIEQGELSAGHGRALLGLSTPEQQMEVANQIIKANLSVRETEALVRQLNKPAHEKEEKLPDPYVKEAERDLTAQLGRRVSIAPGKKKGKVTLEFYDQEDLNLLLDALKTLPAGKEGKV